MKPARWFPLLLILALLAASLSACRRSEGGVSGPALEPTLAAGIDQSIEELDQMLQGFEQDLELLGTPIGP